MLFECDTCDLVFDSADECQQHMSLLGHLVETDSSDDGISDSASVTASSERSTSMSISRSNGSREQISESKSDDDSSDSDLSTSVSENEEAVATVVDASRYHDQDGSAHPTLTEQWLEAQEADKVSDKTQSGSPNLLSCFACQIVFATWDECKAHMNLKRHWVCEGCARTFDSWHNAKAHMTARNHWAQGERQHVYSTRPGAATGGKIEPETVKPPKQYLCATCSRAFGSADSMRSHMNAKGHWAKAQQSIPSRPRALSQKSSPDSPGQQADVNSCWVCLACDRAFKTRSATEEHVRSTNHQKGMERRRGYDCHTCERTFITQAACVAHMEDAGHKKPRTIKCGGCPAMFSTQKHLQNHVAITGHASRSDDNRRGSINVPKGPSLLRTVSASGKGIDQSKKILFKCETCNAHFKNQVDAGQHMSSKNHWGFQNPGSPSTAAAPQNTAFNPYTGPVRFTCETCSSTFSSTEAFMQHIVCTGHRKSAFSPVTSQNFITSYGLARSM